MLPILGEKKNENSVTLHNDMKQRVFILFQTTLKSSIVKGELFQVHLCIPISVCVPGNAIISEEWKHNKNL